MYNLNRVKFDIISTKLSFASKNILFFQIVYNKNIKEIHNVGDTTYSGRL